MSRVVLLAYFFPPIGGAGSQRWLKLAKYLPEFGFEVTVVTGQGESSGRWSPLDETLAAELPPGMTIRRLTKPEPGSSGTVRARTERWLRRDSPWDRWWVNGAVREGIAALEDAEVVVASMSPYSSASAASEIRAATATPWIADLRDPWALDEMMIHPTRIHRRLELAKMSQLLETSSAIVTTTAEAAQLIRARFPALGVKPIVSIPNGFDSRDFVDPPEPRRDSRFRIVHTGYLHTDIGLQQRRTSFVRKALGGSMPGLDIMARSHRYLLEAIDGLIARDPGSAGEIELHLAGILSETDRRLADRYPFIRLHGYVEHREAIRLMQSADLLFLPMQRMPPGIRSSIVPGKTYEYLAARRPILAAVPAGDARDILAESGVALIVAPDDTAGLGAAIERELRRKRSGDPAPEVSEEVIERFERRNLAARYGTLLKTIGVD